MKCPQHPSGGVGGGPSVALALAGTRRRFPGGDDADALEPRLHSFSSLFFTLKQHFFLSDRFLFSSSP